MSQKKTLLVRQKLSILGETLFPETSTRHGGRLPAFLCLTSGYFAYFIFAVQLSSTLLSLKKKVQPHTYA